MPENKSNLSDIIFTHKFILKLVFIFVYFTASKLADSLYWTMQTFTICEKKGGSPSASKNRKLERRHIQM